MSRARIIVSGMVAGTPSQGGATWAVLQYVLGLRKLGHDVWLVEPVEQFTSHTAGYFRRVVAAFGLDGRASLVKAATQQTIGVSYGELIRAAAGADIVLNVGGMLRDENLTEGIKQRVYLDLDPVFTHLWHAHEGIDMRLDGHTHFVTVGQRIGEPGCVVPTCDRRWTTMLPPVVLEHWPVSRRIEHNALTTVGNWRSYGPIELEGVRYGQRAHSLRSIVELPTMTDECFSLALAIHPDERRDLTVLRDNGWRLLDPAEVAGTPDDYKRFIGGSRAEFAIAKSGYVFSKCGWFSDRSACYLACGRPVLAQQTGWDRTLPAGDGLLAWTATDDAIAGIEELRSDYDRHARAARELAESFLDSDRVLTELLECL
jgi:hypothetical protein